MGAYDQNIKASDYTFKNWHQTNQAAHVVIKGQSGEDIADDTGQLKVVLDGVKDDGNSTTIPLSADAVFTGTSIDTLKYAIISISVYSDVASATDGMSIQQSSDGTNWYWTDEYTVPAGTGKVYSIQTCAQYFRIVYTNGDTDQTAFDLSVVLKKGNTKPSSHRIQDSISSDDDAELIKSVLTGENPSGTFVNFQATTQGNFKISLEELENDVSVNSNTQLKVTPYHADGTEGILITGIDYVSGKSGIDAVSETLQTLEYEHHEIHNGTHFNYCDYQLGNAVNDTIELVVTTPDSATWIHFQFRAYSSGGAKLELYEGTTGVTGGTSITSRNNNRNSATVSVITLVKDPTAITNDGTRAGGYLAGVAKQAGIISRNNEFILKQNTSYLARITSLANSNDISWCSEWYEHVSKN